MGFNIAPHLCELAESLAKQNKITFLPNSANPEKSLIIFDIDALISTFSRQLLTSQQLSSIELSHMTNVSEIPWSRIQPHLPDLGLDPSSVVAFLKSLGYQTTSHGTLRLSYSNDAISLSSDSTGFSTLTTKWPSTDSGISSASCLTTSSGASIEQKMLLPPDSRNFSERDDSCGSSLGKGESTHFDSEHDICVIHETSDADACHETESYLAAQNKLLKDSDNKCSTNKNCCTQDSDKCTKGSTTHRRRGKVNICITNNNIDPAIIIDKGLYKPLFESL